MGSGRLRPQNRTDALQEPYAADSAEEQAESPRPGTARSDVPTPNVRDPGLLFSYSRHRRIPPDAGRIPPEEGAILLPALPLLRAVSRPLPEPVPRFQNRRSLRLSGMRVFIALSAVRRALSAEGFSRRSSLVCFLPYVSFAGSRSPQEEGDPQNPTQNDATPFCRRRSFASFSPPLSFRHAAARGRKTTSFLQHAGEDCLSQKKTPLRGPAGHTRRSDACGGLPAAKKSRIVGQSSETSGS